MKQAPNHRRTHNKPFTLFVFTLALVCQLFMPFTQALATLTMDETGDNSRSIVFCTPLGLTVVSINADAENPIPLSTLPKACEFCQICELNTEGVGINKTTIAYSFIAPTSFILRPEHFSAGLKQAASSRQFPARAPPRLT